ncbi:hypothetical protein ABVN23_29330 [Pseudomonas fluorescens]|uniref:hypothetical protein n=1 Tax=Pseudomonas fluorescens TaxID=294 RepID=UPI003F9CE197
MSSSASVLLRPYVEPLPMLVSVAGAMLMLILALLICLPVFCFNQHNAERYAMAVAQEHEFWWEHHRQSAGLVEAVLLVVAPLRNTDFGCSVRSISLRYRRKLLKERLFVFCRCMAVTFVERERNLAILLALQWQAQLVQQPFQAQVVIGKARSRPGSLCRTNGALFS